MAQVFSSVLAKPQNTVTNLLKRQSWEGKGPRVDVVMGHTLNAVCVCAHSAFVRLTMSWKYIYEGQL